MTNPMRFSVLALAALLVACAPEPASDSAEATTGMEQPASVDPAAIRAQVADFVSAWNEGDLEALGGSLAEDAVLMQPDGPALIGGAQILDVIKDNYDFNLMTQSATVDEAVGIGDMAYARGTWTLQPRADADLEMPVMNGKWSAIYKKGPDGGWQTWRWMWNQPAGQTAGVEVSE